MKKVTGPPQHTSLASEWSATIDETVARLAKETAAHAEQAGVEAGEPAEDVTGRPQLGPRLREDLVDELVVAAMAFWATGIPRLALKALPGLVAWWITRRAERAKASTATAANDAVSRRLLEIDGRFYAAAQKLSQTKPSRREVRDLAKVRSEYVDFLEGELPSYIEAPARRSYAEASEWLAKAYASRGEIKQAAVAYRAAEEAWERVGDPESASRCRSSRDELS